MDILYLKYGDINFWTHTVPFGCSAFFKALSYTASIVKPHIWINCVNPFTTSVMFHPWMFVVPIAFKPMPLNMDVNFDLCHISEFIINSSCNKQALDLCFGTG